MRILSYRGPSAPGGVSNSLMQIFNEHESVSEWWFVLDHELVAKKQLNENTSYSLGEKLVSEHYAYCNNFLWPILHDMPHLARFSETEQKAYHAFNAIVSFRLRVAQKILNDECFVNDYQFALIPDLVKKAMDTFVFWHIPWPKTVWKEHSAPLSEIANGLLSANVIGFHIQEYVDNFIDFVARNLPHLEVRRDVYGISVKEVSGSRRLISLVCSPLGVDSFHWNRLAKRGLSSAVVSSAKVPFILSVDRCDYTKGILERLGAIDEFFSMRPEWKEKIEFLQIGARSRPGLTSFDQYWRLCQNRYHSVNTRHAVRGWQPVRWIDAQQSASELSVLYSRSLSMIVSPVRDGLNLTAKEYVASQHNHPGGLLLSPGAGVFKEIGKHCVEVEIANAASFAKTIASSLEMGESERYRRIHLLKSAVMCNSLSSWWQSFLHICEDRKMILTDKRASGL